ncbi:MAG: hypothetical protein P1P84_18635 [Deferrisomatales bacterium]|nr:hypothetical protein [Deferrisomatales bacterium]
MAKLEGLAIHPRSGRIVTEFDKAFLREPSPPPFRIAYPAQMKRT